MKPQSAVEAFHAAYHYNPDQTNKPMDEAIMAVVAWTLNEAADAIEDRAKYWCEGISYSNALHDAARLVRMMG